MGRSGGGQPSRDRRQAREPINRGESRASWVDDHGERDVGNRRGNGRKKGKRKKALDNKTWHQCMISRQPATNSFLHNQRSRCSARLIEGAKAWLSPTLYIPCRKSKQGRDEMGITKVP